MSQSNTSANGLVIVASNQIVGPSTVQDDMTFGWLYEWVDEIKAVSPNSGQVSFISENEADWVGKIHSSDVPRLSKPETPCVQTIDVQDDQMILPAATAAAAE